LPNCSERIDIVKSNIAATGKSRYLPAQIFLHWTIAMLIVIAWLMPQVWESTSREATGVMISVHRSLGMTVLALVFLRAVWRLISPPPALPAATTQAVRWAAHVGHAVLYLLMVAVPVLGMLFTWASGRDLSFWGLFTLPAPIAPDAGLKGLFLDLHALSANTIMVVVGLHAAAALFHQYIFKDGLLDRMLPRRLRSQRRGPGALV
jgi:cytochrome b561